MQLTFLPEEPPAKPSRSPASEPDWLTLAETSPSPSLGLSLNIDRKSWFGKMSPVSLVSTEDGHLAPSSGGWQNSGMGGPTGSLTLSTPEHLTSPTLFHSDGAVCSLSDILETGDVPQRYYLTARACAGILRRAEKRGKQLPELLARALRAVAGSEPTSTSGGGIVPESQQVAGALGAGDGARGWRNDLDQGAFIPESMADSHALRAEGFDASEDGTGRGTPLVPEAQGVSLRGRDEGGTAELSGPISTALRASQGGGDKPHALVPEVSPALKARDHKGPSSDGDGDGAPILPVPPSQPIPFDTTQITHPANRSNPQPGDPSGTLAKEGHAPVIAFGSKDSGVDASVGDTPTLRAGSFDNSHANAGVPPAVALPMTFDWQAGGGGNDKSFKGKSRAYVTDPPGRTRAIISNRSLAVALQDWRVRRLTPTECERLMGMPDDYTQIPRGNKPTADGPRYKALGNSWAVNVARVIGERIDLIVGRNS